MFTTPVSVANVPVPSVSQASVSRQISLNTVHAAPSEHVCPPMAVNNAPTVLDVGVSNPFHLGERVSLCKVDSDKERRPKVERLLSDYSPVIGSIPLEALRAEAVSDPALLRVRPFESVIPSMKVQLEASILDKKSRVLEQVPRVKTAQVLDRSKQPVFPKSVSGAIRYGRPLVRDRQNVGSAKDKDLPSLTTVGVGKCDRQVVDDHKAAHYTATSSAPTHSNPCVKNSKVLTSSSNKMMTSGLKQDVMKCDKHMVITDDDDDNDDGLKQERRCTLDEPVTNESSRDYTARVRSTRYVRTGVSGQSACAASSGASVNTVPGRVFDKSKNQSIVSDS